MNIEINYVSLQTYITNKNNKRTFSKTLNLECIPNNEDFKP